MEIGRELCELMPIAAEGAEEEELMMGVEWWREPVLVMFLRSRPDHRWARSNVGEHRQGWAQKTTQL